MSVKYDDTEFRRIRGELVTLAGLTLKIGIVGPGATSLESGSSLTLAELGLVHEYGAKIQRDGYTIDIPERSWLRSTIIARRADIALLQAAVYREILAGKRTARSGLEIIGVQVVAWIREAIIAGIDPPLATSTILDKKSTKPLIDHGQLINSISFEVVAVAAAKQAAA